MPSRSAWTLQKKEMERSISPLHVHVGKKTPVHVHLSSGGRSRKSSTLRLSEAKLQKYSSAEMSAGRPSLRASASVSPTRSSRLRASHWVNASSSKGPWVPPPGKATKTRMSWEGPTHRLEINPVGVDPSGSTVLRMSDLNSEEGSTDVIVAQESSAYDKKLTSLQAEVEHLKTEADLNRSLRSLEGKELELQESRLSLRDKEVELSSYREDLLEKELENAKLRTSIARLSPPRPRPRPSADDLEVQQRDRLLKKLVEMEMDSTEVSRQANSLRDAIRKLQRERRFSSVYAADVAEQKDILLERLAQFESSNKTLRKMIRTQQSVESSKSNLQMKLGEAESTNQLLRVKLDEQEKLALHSQSLHDEIGMKEGEVQSLSIRLQSMEEQLRHREEKIAGLEAELAEVRRKGQREKEMLKRATKQHRSQAAQSEHTVEALAAQIEDMTGELDHAREKLSKSTREQISQQAEIRTLTVKLADLEEALAQSKQAHRTSLDTISAKLSDKTHELNSSQLEGDQLRAMVASLEGRAKVTETTAQSKMSALEAEVGQMKVALHQQEALTADYKARVDQSHRECEELGREVRKREQEIERAHQDKIIELEKCHLKYQQQISQLEPVHEQLKATEIRLKDAQERLIASDQRSSEQTRLIAELTAKTEHHGEAMESLREKWHSSSADNRSLSSRLESSERRLREVEEQNRELMSVASRKEESAERLQSRVEELIQEASSLTAQLEGTRSDAKRTQEHIKDRAASKDRANLARISDLESQLSRANTLATQFRKAKEDTDRRYHSRVHELQERLDQANATKRSMENYVNFLKSSYASVFNDSGTPGSPLPTFKL